MGVPQIHGTGYSQRLHRSHADGRNQFRSVHGEERQWSTPRAKVAVVGGGFFRGFGAVQGVRADSDTTALVIAAAGIAAKRR